ncbi:MAG: hypothetical protein JXB50_03870 [Spirochaetes bacterium]|nr:hypothetical protein [Spirochaetota bacterium]
MINRLKTIEYHFVLNDSLKNKLMTISENFKLKLSKTVIFILENMTPLFNKMHLLYKEENNAVEIVNWNCHLHVYINRSKEELYNKLKTIHKDNNTYSIASQLRYIIKVFIRGVERYGLSRFLKILKKAEEKWKNIKRNEKIWHKKVMVRQLSLKKHFAVQYDRKYSVILIKLLN